MDENRDELIMRLIKQSRAEFQLKQLSANELTLTTEQWLKRLSVIPTDWLERTVDRAIGNHNQRSAIIPSEILEAWNGMQGQFQQENKKKQEEKQCPYSCSIDGWVVVNADNVLVTGSTPPGMTTYARPCTIQGHRPQGA